MTSGNFFYFSDRTVAMKRRWTDDELLQHFTLHPDELALLSSTTDHNRLGFAVLPSRFQASYVDTPPKFATHCWLPFVCVVLLRLPMTWLNVWIFSSIRWVPEPSEESIKNCLKIWSASVGKTICYSKLQKPHFQSPMEVLKKSSIQLQMSRHCETWLLNTIRLVPLTVPSSILLCVIP